MKIRYKSNLLLREQKIHQINNLFWLPSNETKASNSDNEVTSAIYNVSLLKMALVGKCLS